MDRKILIVEDDTSFSITLKTFLERQGFKTETASSAQKASEKIRSGSYDVVLTDFRLPDQNGIELLKIIKENRKETLVILMTAYGDIRMAVKAIKHGAYEYIAKPVNPEELLDHINTGLKKHSPNENDEKQPASKSITEYPVLAEYLEATSNESKLMHEHISLVAPTEMSVIIQGESGTGKEFIARKIHEMSRRNKNPFIAVDCGALSKDLAGSEFFGHLKGSFTGAIQDKTGQFEVANHGTIFLDEIGNLSYDIQIKLLRAIQERQIRKIGSNKDIAVDVRIIVATNEDLQKEVKNGNFREDLYHRLNEFTIHVHPLRERKSDIQPFVNHFLKKANAELGRDVKVIPDNLMEVLVNYSWPGNIREVKNVIRRAVLLSKGNELDKSALPREIIFSAVKDQSKSDHNDSENYLKVQTGITEKEIIIETLQKVKYNKSKAAKLLNIDRRTLYNKLKLYGISLD
ncbi:MAG: sigma-54 dependent transcriptional regulator [Bacteroidales bacterium]|nr:sigma-54 dependent transcriptional regulator [Bacteroidales bacterium]